MLINCAAYQDGRKLADITVEAISDYVEKPDCFVWVALRDATADELETMRNEFNLHPLAVEDARHGHQRPKVEEYGDSIFVVMHLLEIVNGVIQIGEVNIFVGPNYVLSIRNRSTASFLGVRDRCEREPHLLRHGAGFVLYALMDAVVDRYFPLIDELESELEAIEDQIFSGGDARGNIERLYALKRKTVVLKHAVSPCMEATSKLLGGRVPTVCSNSEEYFRDVYDHLARINNTLDTLRDTIGTAIQVNLSLVAMEQNEVHKKLAAWAGIFAIITSFAGIWGMNFETMPELKWTLGYPFALLCMALSCGYVYRRFKRSGWL